MRIQFPFIALLCLVLFSCSPKIIPDITMEQLKSQVEYLASDQLKGRYPGTPEDSMLSLYISQAFRRYGLNSFNSSYFQSFDFLSGITPDSKNSLLYKTEEFIQGEDFLPLSFSGSGELGGKVAFGGYGFDFQTDEYSRNDYKSIDPKDKWILILRGEPENHPALIERSRDRDKAMLAAEKGAIGVLLVSGEEYSASDDLPVNLSHEPQLGIPVLSITRKAANLIVQESNHTVAGLEKSSKKENPLLLITDQVLTGKISIEKRYSKTANIMGYLEGTAPSLNEWIVVGAHHDHLGMGGKGSSSRFPDTIAVHKGADDNASGVAAVLELAEYFSAKENRTQRNLLFITFGAEEKGLLGSRYFTNNAPIDLHSISAMINLDMMGRMNEDSSLQLGGVGSSLQGREITDRANEFSRLNLSLSEAGYGPSDHASFYTHDIPVFFLSTGAHSDYHTPFDDAELINYRGLVLGTEFTASLVKEIDQVENKLAFREAGPKTNTSRSFRNRITLGIMPDVSGEGKEGMAVLAVTAGKPAEQGGMKKGDIITAIEGKAITNVYDYMYRLNELKAGERIVVTVKRNNSILDLLIQL